MLNLNSIMIGTYQPKVLAAFYEGVFERKPDMADEGYSGWQVGGGWLNIGEHSEISGKSKEPQRVIFNFETKMVKEEFERISKIEGVEVIKEPYDPAENSGMLIATLADPDGNYFQLMSPWEENA
jgi:predicted enzyme related to lactoylglutathione lyase